MSVTRMFRLAACGLVLATGAQGAYALEDIPTTSGFSGTLGIGAGYTDAETNLVKGSSLWDIGQESVSSVSRSPKGEDDAFIFPRGEFAYTFGGPQIQLFLASDVEELVDLEVLQQVGIRKQFETLGIVSLGYVTSGLLNQEVWQDPYSSGSSRSDTDREFTGVRFEWDRIAGLPIGLLFQYKDIEVDDERSGSALGLTLEQQSDLSREGDNYRAEFSYTWRRSANEVFRPYFGYVDADLDGDATKYSGPYVGLDAGYQNETWGVAGRARVGSKDKSERNPVYNRRTDGDWYEIVLRGNYRLPWGENWFGTGGVAWAKEENNVNFHDQRNLLFTLGAEWRFGPDK
ncbi:MAG: DUF2860 family protein [Chromatiales bacterium]|nr:MAG: DUF2860 family protein [Chromatiales bacterium]